MTTAFEQRLLIDEIRADCLGVNEKGRKHLQPALKLIAEQLYAQDHHFLYELIQNADDNEYKKGTKPSLLFKLLQEDPTKTAGSEGTLIIVNNEAGFVKDDVKSICSINTSTKKNKKSFAIGEKGIGFKSVFQVSPKPHIISNGYQFFFDEKPKEGLPYIMPTWIDVLPQLGFQFPGDCTVQILPLKKGYYQQIANSLKTQISPEILLFLNKLQEITVDIPNTASLVVSRDAHTEDLSAKITSIKSNDVIYRYWMCSQDNAIPKGVAYGPRESLARRIISIAFPLDTSASAHPNAFAYLPTNINTGFPFYVNADFILNASREDIKDPTRDTWNKWLLSTIPGLFMEAFMALLESSNTKHNAYKFVPVQCLSPAFQECLNCIHKALQSKPTTLCLDTNLHMPSESYYTMKEVYDLLVASPLPYSHPMRSKLVDPKLLQYSSSLEILQVRSLTGEEIIKNLLVSNITWIRSHSVEWYLQLYKILSTKELFNVQNMPNALQMYSEVRWKLVPTNKAVLSAVTIYFPAAQHIIAHLQQNPGLAQNITFVSLDLFNICGPHIISWMEHSLGVKRMDESVYTTILIEDLHRRVTDDTIVNYTQFIVQYLDKLSGAVSKMIQEELPVLTTAGILPSTERSFIQLVLPDKLVRQSDLYWKKLFPTDAKHFRALSDKYLESTVSATKWKSFFETYLSAKENPPYQVTYNTVDQLPIHLMARWLALPYKERTLLQATDFPEFGWLQNPSEYRNTERAAALVQWLDQALLFKRDDTLNSEITYESVDDKLVCHFWKTNSCKYKNFCKNPHAPVKKVDKQPAGLLDQLRSTPWMPTADGQFSVPTEVLVDTVAMREMFGNSLPYAAFAVPERVAKLLNLKRDVSKAGLLDRLISMASTFQIPERSQITKLYSLINGYLEENELPFLQEEFKSKPLILATVNGQLQWTYLSDKIIWGKDVPPEISDGFVCLSKDYPAELSSFFKKIGVQNTLKVTAALDYLLVICKELPSKQTVEMLYGILADAQNERDKDFIRQTFQDINLIYIKGAKDYEWRYTSDIAWVDPFHPSGGISKEYPDLKSFFLDTLKVKMYASVTDILQRLADMSVAPEVDFETVKNIYDLLHKYYKDSDSSVQTVITKGFADNALIYLPQDGSWHQPDECLWQVEPDFKDEICYLSKSYTEPFREFFANVGVPPAPTLRMAATIWQRTVAKSNTLPRPYKESILSAFYRLLSTEFPVSTDWWTSYQRNLLILTADGSMVPPAKVYWSLDGALLDVFDNLPIAWKPKGFNNFDFHSVCQVLGVRDLSGKVEMSYVFEAWTAFYKPVLTPHLKEWFCCNLWNQKYQKLFHLDKDSRLFNWLSIEEIPVKSIDITYKFDDKQKTITENTHFDLKTGKFYVYGNHDKIEVGTELSKTLQMFAPDTIHGNWEDFFEANKCMTQEKLQLLTKRTQKTLPEHIKDQLRDILHTKDQIEDVTDENEAKKYRKRKADSDAEDEEEISTEFAEDDSDMPLNEMDKVLELDDLNSDDPSRPPGRRRTGRSISKRGRTAVISHEIVTYVDEHNDVDRFLEGKTKPSFDIYMALLHFLYNKELSLRDLTPHYKTLISFKNPYDALQFLYKVILDPQSKPPITKTDDDSMTILWTLQLVGKRLLVKTVEHVKVSRAQREFGKNRFIMLYFPVSGDDLVENEQLRQTYKSILENGFKLAKRKWEFFGFSKGQLKRSCATFIATSGHDIAKLDEVTASTARHWAGDFSALKSVSRCAVNLGRSLTPCTPTIALSNDQWSEYPDVEHDGHIFTEGCGQIAFELAQKVAKHLDLNYTPSAIVIRFGEYKGTLVLSTRIYERLILSKSMRFYDIPKRAKTQRTLEVIDWSKPPKPAFLNRQYIMLLSAAGIPDQVFVNLMQQSLSKASGMLYGNSEDVKKNLKKLASNNGNAKKVLDLLAIGHSLSDTEVKSLIRQIHSDMLVSLRDFPRLKVKKSWNLLGVADVSGKLGPGQIFVQLTGVGTLLGKVCVTKIPAMHPGDLRLLNAVWIDELKHVHDCIVFSTTGPKPVYLEIGGAALYGTQFWVCAERAITDLVRASAPGSYHSETPSSSSDTNAIQRHIDYFLDYILQRSFIPDKIATLHTALADALGMSHRYALRLAELHYKARESAESGALVHLPSSFTSSAVKFPHYMGKPAVVSRHSTSIAGKLFDLVSDQMKALGFSISELKEIPLILSDIAKLTFNEKTTYTRRHTLFDTNLHEVAAEEMLECVLEFERSQGRIPTRCVNKIWDIESKDTSNQTRQIKVKTTLHWNQLALSKEEFDCCVKLPQTFFVYVLVAPEGEMPKKIYEFGNLLSKIPYVHIDSRWTSLADVCFTPEK